MGALKRGRKMNEQKEVENAISHYLERVAAELGNVEPDERRSILQDVESHIYEALEKRSPGAATMADLGFVLAEMVPPWSYGQGRRGVAPPSAPPAAPAPPQVQPREPRLCWYPVVALLLVPVFLVLAAAVSSVAYAMLRPAHVLYAEQVGLHSVTPGVGVGGAIPFIAGIALFALAGGVLPSILGLVGITKIRAARGGLYGMTLAVIMTLLFPLFILDILMLLVGLRGMWLPLGLGIPVTVGAIILVDILICRLVWKWATRPVESL